MTTKKTVAAVEKPGRMIAILACVCSGTPMIHTVSTFRCGVVTQISCKCGKGVHGRDAEEAKALWDVVQLHLHKEDGSVGDTREKCPL